MIDRDITSFRNLFVSYNSRPSLYSLEEHSWSILNSTRYITKNLLYGHLSQDFVLGQVLSGDTKRMAILDFDYHEGIKLEDFNQQIFQVASLFNCPKLMVQSSESHGLHCWLFFKYAPPEVIKYRIENLLNQEGFLLRSGFIELFCSAGQNIRLPFGKCSYILNERLKIETNNPIDLINLSLNKIGDYKYHPTIYEATDRLVAKKTIFCITRQATNYYKADAEQLMRSGLSEYNSMNDSAYKVAIHLIKQGLSRSEALAALTEWAFTKHNGFSKDVYNHSKFSKKLDHIINSVIGKECGEVNSDYIALEDSLCQFINNTNFKFKAKLKLFKVMQFVKKRALTGRSMTISKKFLIEILGLSSSNYQSIINTLISGGYLKLISKGNNLKQHASYYRWVGPTLNFDCGFKSFEEYLYKKKLYKNYSRRIQTKIQSVGDYVSA